MAQVGLPDLFFTGLHLRPPCPLSGCDFPKGRGTLREDGNSRSRLPVERPTPASSNITIGHFVSNREREHRWHSWRRRRVTGLPLAKNPRDNKPMHIQVVVL